MHATFLGFWKCSRSQDALACSNVSLNAGNKSEVVLNSNGHAALLFIKFGQFSMPICKE